MRRWPRAFLASAALVTATWKPLCAQTDAVADIFLLTPMQMLPMLAPIAFGDSSAGSRSAWGLGVGGSAQLSRSFALGPGQFTVGGWVKVSPNKDEFGRGESGSLVYGQSLATGSLGEPLRWSLGFASGVALRRIPLVVGFNGYDDYGYGTVLRASAVVSTPLTLSVPLTTTGWRGGPSPSLVLFVAPGVAYARAGAVGVSPTAPIAFSSAQGTIPMGYLGFRVEDLGPVRVNVAFNYTAPVHGYSLNYASIGFGWARR